MKYKYVFFGILFLTHFVFSQKTEYSVLLIDPILKENANAVVRINDIDLNIESQRKMTYKSIEAITVLNELGMRNLDLTENFDKNTRISKIEARVFDAFGKEIKKYRKGDFKDVSVFDGVSIFNDNRMLYLDYTPTIYPFTIELIKEVETSNTAFIKSWYPMNGYYISTESSSLNITFKPELGFSFKEYNFSSEYNIVKKETTTLISFQSKNCKAKKREESSPGYNNIMPFVRFTIENFHLEGVDGNAKSWKEFGKWYYDKLLVDTEELSPETQIKIKKLVEKETNPIEKAKIVYKYVQDKTRYISVQVGIGGWKPMLAKDVDRLGYGDCKALSNYTRVLLNTVGVPAYYTIVYAGGNDKKDIQEDFVSMQGNHIILAIPTEKEMLWLECTSQIHPFAFQGDFTDHRKVLIIKPEGGEIIKTKTYTEKDNLKKINGSYSILADGMIRAKINMISYGIPYDNEFQKERLSNENQIKNYKEEFSYINNLNIKKINLSNDKNAVQFKEEIELEAENYAQVTGGKLMFALNAFDQSTNIPKKYKNRELPFEIDRGYTIESEFSIQLPEGYIIEAKPDGLDLISEFGTYNIDFISTDNKSILCKRKFILNKGYYESSKFENYRKFIETVAKTDNSKVIISKA